MRGAMHFARVNNQRPRLRKDQAEMEQQRENQECRNRHPHLDPTLRPGEGKRIRLSKEFGK